MMRHIAHHKTVTAAASEVHATEPVALFATFAESNPMFVLSSFYREIFYQYCGKKNFDVMQHI